MSIPFTDSDVLGKYIVENPPTIIISSEPSDTDAVLSSLHHDTTWLIELSNRDPASFIGREAELYSIMNALQLVTGRFAKVA